MSSKSLFKKLSKYLNEKINEKRYYRLFKFAVWSCILSTFFDLGISYAVFKYNPTFFIANELNPFTVLAFQGVQPYLYLFIFILPFPFLACYIMVKYEKRKNGCIRRVMNIYPIIIGVGFGLHILGGFSWL